MKLLLIDTEAEYLYSYDTDTKILIQDARDKTEQPLIVDGALLKELLIQDFECEHKDVTFPKDDDELADCAECPLAGEWEYVTDVTDMGDDGDGYEAHEGKTQIITGIWHGWGDEALRTLADKYKLAGIEE